MLINNPYSYENLILRIKNNPTHWEKKNNVKVTEIRDERHESYGIIWAIKSDNTITLFLFFLIEPKMERWWAFCPNDDQAKFLIERFPKMYEAINDVNTKTKHI